MWAHTCNWILVVPCGICAAVASQLAVLGDRDVDVIAKVASSEDSAAYIQALSLAIPQARNHAVSV